MSVESVFQAQSAFQETLLAKSNVVGVAVGYKESHGVLTGELAVIALVEEKKPLAALSAADVVPREVDGVRTDVYEIGFLEAQTTPTPLPPPSGRFRPTIMPGISMGHYKITAGTFGALVAHRITGERLILSNNHVLANSNEALVGDAILQPGPIDGGMNPDDIVARLEQFVPLNYVEGPVNPPQPPTPDPQPPTPTPPTPTPPPTPPPASGCDVVDVIVKLANALATLLGSSKRVTTTPSAMSASAPSGAVIVAKDVTGASVVVSQVLDNLMDAALARPVSTVGLSDEIRYIGRITGTKAPALGMGVRKAGRTTDLTQGTINLLNATVNVAYNTSLGRRTARFTGQVITGAMSQGGDSGSLIVDAAEPLAVGLLFAGSAVSTIFTPIERVLNEFNIRF